MIDAEAERALAELTERYVLVGSQSKRLARLLELVASDPHAPTTVRDPAHAVSVHLADALVALELEPVRAASRLTDLGAGAGFPGLVLAVALPTAEVSLVESNGRKCRFISEAATALGLANARVVHARAEEWSEGVSVQDVVTARALAAQPVVLEYAAPLLSVGGVLVDWRGKRDSAEEAAANLAAGVLGFGEPDIRRVEPFADARDHHLHSFVKLAPTPERFPRRAGMARKRPLGS